MSTEPTESGKSDEMKELKSKNGEKLIVSNDRKIKKPDECPRCRNHGPWNGVICMSCGYRFHE